LTRKKKRKSGQGGKGVSGESPGLQQNRMSLMLSHRVGMTALAGAPFPPYLRRTLKYCAQISASSSSGSVVAYQYQVNSCYDPDLTSGGHQPRFYDQFCSSAGPYTRYRVLGVRVKVQCMVDGNTPLSKVAFGLSANPVLPSVSGDVSFAGELPSWKTILLSTGMTTAPIEYAWGASVAEIANVLPEMVMTVDAYGAAYGANPVNLVYWNLQYQALSGDSSSAFFIVELEQDVRFEQPYLVAVS